MSGRSRLVAIVSVCHTVFAVASFAAVLLLGAVDACADPPAAADRTARQVFDLPITNGKTAVNGGTIRVKQGDNLELRWSSDRPMSLHLHGYDIETNVTPKAPVAMSFKANLAGRFPVSEHRHGAREQVIVYLEVYP